MTMADLRALIHDSPRMQNPHASLHERCVVHLPELPRWFLTGRV